MMTLAVPTAIAVISGALAHFFLPTESPSIWTHWSLVAPLAFAFTMLIVDCCRPISRSHESREFGAGATQRIAGPTPPPYPNGWFCIAYSWELKRGKTRPIAFLGRQLVAFRGESGAVRVLDAYCPHLGAHLGVSGRVKGDCIECPFHGWQFQGADGKCAKIPGQAAIPPQAHTRAWTVLERNQMVLVWYHCDGEGPSWEPEVIEDVDEGFKRFRKVGRAGPIQAILLPLRRLYTHCFGKFRLDAKEDFVVNAHIQEIPENTADVAHLNVLHHLPWDIPIVEDHFRMDWQGWWRVSEEQAHVGIVPVVQQLYLFGKPIPFLRMTTDITLLGPGLVLYLFHTPIGTMRLFETVTPGASPMTQQISLVLFSSCWTPRWAAKWFFRGVAKTLSQDCFIWNNKTYNNKPPLAKGDRYLLTFRKWYSQFYTETSVPMQDASRKISLDW